MKSELQNCTGSFLVASPYLTDGHFFRSVVFIIRHSHEGAFGVVVNRNSSKRFSEIVELSSPTWKPGSAKTFSLPPQDPALESATADDSAAENSATQDSATQDSTPLDAAANETVTDSTHRDQIYIGGPVEGPLLALHEIAGIGEPCGDVTETDKPRDDGSDSAHDPAGTKTTLHDHPAEAWGSMSIQWSDVPAWMTADEDHLRILLRREDSRIKFIVGYSGWGPGQLESELDGGGWLVTPADAESIFEDADEVWEKLVHRCGQAILKDLSPDLSFPDEDSGFDPRVN